LSNSKDITKSVQELTELYLKNFGLSEAGEINWGYCFHFALRLKEKLAKQGIQSIIVDSCQSRFGGASHTVLKVRGKYYDAVTPQGIKSLNEIRDSGDYTEGWVECPIPLHPKAASWRSYSHENGSAYSEGSVPSENRHCSKCIVGGID